MFVFHSQMVPLLTHFECFSFRAVLQQAKEWCNIYYDNKASDTENITHDDKIYSVLFFQKIPEEKMRAVHKASLTTVGSITYWEALHLVATSLRMFALAEHYSLLHSFIPHIHDCLWQL
jgi:hypothetical protein